MSLAKDGTLFIDGFRRFAKTPAGRRALRTVGSVAKDGTLIISRFPLKAKVIGFAAVGVVAVGAGAWAYCRYCDDE